MVGPKETLCTGECLTHFLRILLKRMAIWLSDEVLYLRKNHLKIAFLSLPRTYVMKNFLRPKHGGPKVNSGYNGIACVIPANSASKISTTTLL